MVILTDGGVDLLAGLRLGHLAAAVVDFEHDHAGHLRHGRDGEGAVLHGDLTFGAGIVGPAEILHEEVLETKRLEVLAGGIQIDGGCGHGRLFSFL